MEELCHSSQPHIKICCCLKGHTGWSVQWGISKLWCQIQFHFLHVVRMLLLMKEAWTMCVKANCSAAAGLKCYIPYNWKVYERNIAMIKILGAERENRDEKTWFYCITQNELNPWPYVANRVLKNSTHIFSSRSQNHRTVRFGRNLWRSFSPAPLLNQVPLDVRML